MKAVIVTLIAAHLVQTVKSLIIHQESKRGQNMQNLDIILNLITERMTTWLFQENQIPQMVIKRVAGQTHWAGLITEKVMRKSFTKESTIRTK